MKLLDCRFCDIVSGKYQYKGIDEPFASNEEFVAIASIGALIEGWSLIIPKAHQLSMKNIYANSMLADLLSSVIQSLAYQYGPLIAFEHGSNKEGSITACGTDHAHLHLVPFEASLLPELQGSGMTWIQCRPAEIAMLTGNNEYLFYCELASKKVWQEPMGYLHILERPISQFFRHIIANQCGLSELSDYRSFPHLDRAKQTRRVLAGTIV